MTPQEREVREAVEVTKETIVWLKNEIFKNNSWADDKIAALQTLITFADSQLSAQKERRAEDCDCYFMGKCHLVTGEGKMPEIECKGVCENWIEEPKPPEQQRRVGDRIKLRDDILEMFTFLNRYGYEGKPREEYIKAWQEKYGNRNCADVLDSILSDLQPVRGIDVDKIADVLDTELPWLREDLLKLAQKIKDALIYGKEK